MNKAHDKEKIKVIAINIETNEIFEFNGIKFMCRQLGLHFAGVKKVLDGKLESTKGWIIKYKENVTKL